MSLTAGRERLIAIWLIPVWVGIGASLPDTWRKPFQTSVNALALLVGSLGQATQAFLRTLPNDWPIVATIADLPTVPVGVGVATLIVLFGAAAPKVVGR